MRVRWYALGLILTLGCASLPVAAPSETPITIEKPEIAVEDDPLTQAADCLARGDEPTAANHFEVYVRRNPDQLMFRVHLADLCFKLQRTTDAKAHYERFIAGAQDSTGTPQSRLVHCHTRLMEIAQEADDRFAELLHRGVGLVILMRRETDDRETREEILCKAIATLMEAKNLRPGDPRVCVYLAEAHERAGNRRAADTARASASNRMMPQSLTSNELRQLELTRP